VDINLLASFAISWKMQFALAMTQSVVQESMPSGQFAEQQA
jgi:hypothetical protein